ncbi:anhydro-N-acetylmuramic acid kinase-like [Dysidea avara]|uniref:anhydro-N-acetylmuramic acid kinase-like n=1 Tax=Dysidea avara TaxID=196820 RepID=UPI00332AE045
MAAESCLAIGLISGTSADGIDACIVKIACKDDGTFELEVVGFDTYAYPEGLKQKIFDISERGSVQEICLYNVLLGKLFAEAAKRVCVECGVALESVLVIGSHGQTIHHIPGLQSLFGHQVAATLQIGDPSVIANECGVTSVGDFRVADMSVGGQGAPLVPYLDKILLKKFHQDTGRHGALLNIGGISNISIYMPNEDKMIGFDCGPGNMVVDGLMEELFGQPYDDGGEHAKRGKVCQDLLQQFLKDDYYSKPPPKSTGREVYGKVFIKLFLEAGTKYNLSADDFVATATELTAETVRVNYYLHVRPLLLREQDTIRAVLFVSGGGVHNDHLMRRLKELLVDCDIESSMNFNIDPNAKEAVCFALLAYQTLKGVATNIPDVTGASRPVVLGKICPVVT